jgi:hypothetical protein
MEKDDEGKPWITWKNLAITLLGASGFLVQLWVGHIDKQITGYDKRLYEHESQYALLEAENKRLREDHDKMADQLRAVCRATRSC